jgi:hypothetical protein
MIFSKIFSNVWLTRKNYERRKCNCCRNPAMSGCRCRILARMFGRIPAILAWSGRIPAVLARFGRIRPASDHGRILASFGRNLVCRHPATVAGCRWIMASTVFRWPDVAGFWPRLDSDDQPLPDSGNQVSNVGARAKTLISVKTVNRFSKIKEAFMVKPKMIFVDHYFRPYQTL